MSASCDYNDSVQFEDVLEVFVRVARLGTKSVTYEFEFHLQNEIVANGKMTTVCCRINHGNLPESIAIPSWVVKQLQTFQATTPK